MISRVPVADSEAQQEAGGDDPDLLDERQPRVLGDELVGVGCCRPGRCGQVAQFVEAGERVAAPVAPPEAMCWALGSFIQACEQASSRVCSSSLPRRRTGGAAARRARRISPEARQALVLVTVSRRAGGRGGGCEDRGIRHASGVGGFGCQDLQLGFALDLLRAAWTRSRSARGKLTLGRAHRRYGTCGGYVAARYDDKAYVDR